MRRSVLLALLVVALGGCQAVGSFVGDETGMTPRQRYAQWGDYYAQQDGQSAEDVAAIMQARDILRGAASAE